MVTRNLCVVSMATHKATLKNEVVATKSNMSRLLLDLHYKIWYKIKAKIKEFHHMIRNANKMYIYDY